MVGDIQSLFKKINETQKILWLTSMILVGLAFVSLGLFFFDSRLLLGENVWIKPLKFQVSLAIYLLTMGAVFVHSRWEKVASIAKAISLISLIEIAVIVFQASRGVRSHFNIFSAFDGALYSIMGFAIGINTVLVLWVLIKMIRSPELFSMELAWTYAFKWGLYLFLLGSVFGAYMAAQVGHTVGSEDGGPGLPLLGWSTVAGDLRVGHFVGLHGIHVLLILVYALRQKGLATQKILQLTTFAGGVLFLLTVSAFVAALSGVSLFSCLNHLSV